MAAAAQRRTSSAPRRRHCRKKNVSELLIFGNPAKKRRKKCKGKNPGELLIFGNPPKGHKPGCKCFACKRRPRASNSRKYPNDPPGYAKRVRDLEKEGLTTSDAQAVADAEFSKKEKQNPRRPVKHRNPSDQEQAVRLFESFTGSDAKGIVEKQMSAAIRLDYAALGDLDYLKVKTPDGERVEFNFEGDGVKLASSPDGKQLYCIGGRQDLSRCLDAASLQKDFVDLGDCLEVQYVARKIHGNFEPIAYFHKFGEKTGDLPRLMYNKLHRQVYFVGGAYFINTKNGVSPGIEN